MTTTDRSAHTAPAPLDLAPLRTALAGEVAGPGDAGWDDARRAWNLAVDQRPAAVARPADAADVAAAVAFARRGGLRVAPQGTGHGASALPALDDVLLLRTDRMTGIAIDPAARRARVEAGALWGDVAVQAGAAGLAALHGSSIDVGVVGYTLGGGIGWLSRLHGLACNRVTAIELVTADGELRRVGADDGLFWALRGGAGAYGVVTALEFELIPLAEVYAGQLVFPGASAGEALQAYRDWARTVPDAVTSTVRFLRLPPLPMVPEPLRGVPVLDVCVAFAGSHAEGEALVAPLRAAAPTISDTLATIPAPQLVTLHGDPEQPVPGLGHHALLDELTDEAIATLLEVAGPDSGSPLLGVELRQLGGALGRAEAGAGALASLPGEYALYGIGAPMAPGAAEAISERLDLVVDAVAPWTTGRAYLNFADRPADGGAAFDEETLAGLRAVKQAVDPEDLFLAKHPL